MALRYGSYGEFRVAFNDCLRFGRDEEKKKKENGGDMTLVLRNHATGSSRSRRCFNHTFAVVVPSLTVVLVQKINF